MSNVFSLLVYDAFISGVTGRILSGQSLQFSLWGRDWSRRVDCFPREGGRRLCEGSARKDEGGFNHSNTSNSPVFLLGITIIFDNH